MGICNTMRFVLTTISALLLAACLSACDSGKSNASLNQNGQPPEPSESTSPLLVSLTDAEGDFLRYEVAVSAISLKRANGAQVAILAREASVDFSQYVELSELLTVLEAPVGRYESASITLDYSQAEILVQDPNGQAVPGVAITAEGEAITELTVDIEFGDSEGFEIRPGMARHLALDFDLDESNQIEYTPGGANIVVSPVLYIDSAHAQPKPLRVRGLLTQVNQQNSSFNLALRPFQIRQFAMGQGSVYISNETQFEINGDSVESSQGLQALNELGVGGAVVTLGQWQAGDQKYLATHVFAGSSVPWGNADIASGTVVARNELELTLRAVTIELVNGQFQFHNTLMVNLAEDTNVVRLGEGKGSINQISVGSNITVMGEMSNGLLNAAQGLVRIVPTTLSGTVADENELALNLHLLNGLKPGNYDFSGTGFSELEDADHDHYQVDVGALNVEGLAVNEPVRVRGWIANYGQAPADITATTIIDNSDVAAHLSVNLDPALFTENPIWVGETQLMLNMQASAGVHHIFRAGIPLSLEAQEMTLSAHKQQGIYSLSTGKRLRVYSDFGRFSAALAFAQDQGMAVTKVRAHGFFDQQINAMSVYRCRVTLE